jgi:acetyl esterase/lipase
MVSMSTTTRYCYGSHAEQIADLTVPDGNGPFPVLIMLHGGAFAAGPTIERLTPLCEDLASAGLATWNVEYRRLEGTGGGWPTTWQDAASATDFLSSIATDQKLDLNRVAAFGHSAGAPLALWLASRTSRPPLAELGGAPAVNVRAAISASGVCDFGRKWPERLQAVFRELIGGSPESVPDRYAAISPVQLLPIGAPLLLVHGTSDSTVPVRFSEEFVASARDAGDHVDLLVVDGAEHSDVRDVAATQWPAVRSALIDFVNSVLGIHLAPA